ncbi:MAG: hypothetical protein ACRDT4_23415 [Micromonosporaceae bacterium]
MTEPQSTPIPPSAEAAYLAAKQQNDLVGCVRALLGMTVQLAQTAEGQNAVGGGGDERYVLVYTSPAWLERAGDRPGAGRTVERSFLQLLRSWPYPELGIGVNAFTESEVRIPVRLIPKVLALPEAKAAIAAADAAVTTTAGPVTEAVPIEAPREIHGYRFVRVVDEIVDGAPVLAPERGTVTDPAEQERILGYLCAGAPLMGMTGKVSDMFDAGKGQVVEGGTRTDGRFVWSESVGYYLKTYGIAPEPDFYRAIVAAGYVCPDVPRAVLKGAVNALQERHRQAGELVRAWRDQDS